MICKHCSKEFHKKNAGAVYCSRDCKGKDRLTRKKLGLKSDYKAPKNKKKYYKEKEKYEANCNHCGKPFLSNGHKKYCTIECGRKYHGSSEITKERNRKRLYYLNGGGVIKHCVCPTCSTSFTTNHKRKYCTPECSPHYKEPFRNKDTRTCESCNTTYLAKYRAQRFCSLKCRKHGYVGYKNSERAYYNSKEWKTIKVTFKEFYTHVNGIDLSNKYCIKCYIQQNRLNDMYAVDHIVPRRQGGTDEFSNLQSLCRYHHQSKSAAEGNSIQNRNKGGRPKKRVLLDG